ncbi:MAG TPA: Holliday junction resolvase-like protein [Gemmatimonadales bacterium]|nr:Holliday junction resolvase-like protein [Gemmatimonadales bacterium]
MSTNAVQLVLGFVVGFLLAWAHFLVWKMRHTRTIRADAVRRSQAVTRGKVHEQLVPYLPDFPYDARDVRFVGSPVDLVVFDGLADGRVRRVVFLEVKTGGAGLSGRERSVRDAIRARQVEWAELRVAPSAAHGAA